MRPNAWILAVTLLPSLATAQYVKSDGSRLSVTEDQGTLTIQAVADDVIRVDFRPPGVRAKPTEMMDPKGLRNVRPVGRVKEHEIVTKLLRVILSSSGLSFSSPGRFDLLRLEPGPLPRGIVRLRHPASENLYGMRGNGLNGPMDARLALKNGLLRNSGAPVAAGSQGDGGAPIAYSTHWGLMVDSIDGQFSNSNGVLDFSHGSRKDVEAYVVVGPPKRFMEVVADLTGHPPLPPKWALGFMNSQWGTDEAQVKSIVEEYRAKRIPIDAFIFDFDFKAWGEDNYGEWRWNSTSGPGNVAPNKYPDGQSGAFGRWMAGKGFRMVGIMKPRVLTQNADKNPTQAAMVATAKHWWMPGKQPYQDYFSHRLANDFDFSKPALRSWYWMHARNLFETGISGWWNDEADEGFDSLGFFHMEQSLFDGQRKISNKRVWSINRNFYLGAQRFAFGTWSGDIRSGFRTMSDQRTRMLQLIDLGQPHWSMDSGGFNGHPNPENYARWIEFASVVPIMRVHGTYGQRRQPWEYGPVAEAAATGAIRWRYAMFPSFYSWERGSNQSGIGIVRPLFWEFSDDPNCSNTVDEWMLGDGLLVAPVVDQGQETKSVYLPPGFWFDYRSGREFRGPTTVEVPCDTLTWQHMPMFVRAGTILATQPVEQYMGEQNVDELTLEIWPHPSRDGGFEVYDDDGETRSYQRGAFFSQVISDSMDRNVVTVKLQSTQGAYRTPIERYRIRLHSKAARKAVWNGTSLPVSTRDGVSEVEVPAGRAGTLMFG